MTYNFKSVGTSFYISLNSFHLVGTFQNTYLFTYHLPLAMLFTKLITALALAAPVFSIGARVNQFSDGNCKSGIEPGINIGKLCTTWSTPVGKSMTVSTYSATGDTDFTCEDGKNIVLQVWQSSGDCDNSPDATVGPLPTQPQDGGCIIMPIRSAQFACQ
ncbi:hypothetical protein BDV96DRAFT_647051 [Lophiotrema nucula]|uniref:Uncharacterized protein n=1 Tax=Lophiotrema nucula TaxID=690887 RepID=A0A6A5Z5P7_9PLEO|nr:hypothetical protein BDV96DRAFT_647051 [Lophiotrema nucula]